ncbi:MAG: hypothetical protein ACREIA_11600 [Opitutaceae bacterium]
MPLASAQLDIIARRVVWWKPPSEALADHDDFLCRVMVFGTWDDAAFVIGSLGEEAMRHALRHAPAGLFDPASWHYWHHRLGFHEVPELPRRALA